jgi:type II secretory pathway component HofQ
MLALLAGLAAPARAATPRVSVDVDGADLSLVLKLVARQMGADVFLGAEVQGDVTLHVRDAPVHQVLSGLLRPRGLSYRFLGNSLVVAREQALGAIPRDILSTRPGSPWRASLNYSRADLAWVVQIIAREMGKTLVMGRAVSGKVTAVARDVPLEGALALILRLQSPPYGYRLTRDTLVVDLPGELPGRR